MLEIEIKPIPESLYPEAIVSLMVETNRICSSSADFFNSVRVCDSISAFPVQHYAFIDY